VLNVNLISNATLESFYQDRITLQRIYGDIWWRVVPAYPQLEECEPNIARTWLILFRQYFGYQWSMAIRKRLETQVNTVPGTGFAPDFDVANPISGYAWTESSPRWNWQRSGLWLPRGELSTDVLTQGSIIGVCANTSGGALLNPLVAGSGNINTAITTSCAPATAPLEGCPQIFAGQKVQFPPWHHQRIRIKRPIVMARDQGLNVTLGVRLVDRDGIGGNGSWACLDWSALPAPLNDIMGRYNIELYSRIGATIKYN